MRKLISTTILLVALALVPSALAEGGDGNLVDIRGAVAVLDDAVIEVRDGDRELACHRGARSPSLSGVAVGDRIAILCKNVEGLAILVGWKRLDESQQMSVMGRIVELTDVTIVVQGEDTRLACEIGDGAPPTAELRVGDRIAMLCKKSAGASRLVAWKRIGEGEKMRVVDIAGVVDELSDGSITVVNKERGRKLMCVVPDRLVGLLEGLRVGDRAKLLCSRRLDGKPMLLKLKRSEPFENARYVDIAGKVTGNEGGILTITQPATDRSLACKVPVAGELTTAVSQLAVGTRAAMLCRDGVVVKVKRVEDGTSPVSKEFVYRGEITSIGADRIVLSTEDGSRSCVVSDALQPALAELSVGQHIKMMCKGTDAGHAKLVALALID